MKIIITWIIIFSTTIIQARTITIKSREGSITINIRNIDNSGRVKTGELLRIIKNRLEKLEYDYISRLGRYERRGALKEIKAIKVLLTKIPSGNTIVLKRIESPAKRKKTISKRIAMGHQQFNNLLRNIKSKRFSSDKLSSIEQAAKLNFFSLYQLEKLIKIFGKIDSRERIKIIENVYPKVIDKRNAYKLLDYFSFSSDKESVKRILNRNK